MSVQTPVEDYSHILRTVRNHLKLDRTEVEENDTTTNKRENEKMYVIHIQENDIK